MPVLTRTEEEIRDRVTKILLARSGVTATNQGSTAQILAEIAAFELKNAYAEIESIDEATSFTRASGDALDNKFGALFGKTRGGATRAFDDSRNVRFFIDPSTGLSAAGIVASKVPDATVTANPSTLSTTSFTIKAGATLTARGGIAYTTTENVTLSNTDTESFVSVIAGSVGSSFNVSVGQLNTHNLKQRQPELLTIEPFILVDNRMPIENGTFEEGDDAFRARIADTVSELQTGNETAVVRAALSVPGVRNAIFVPYDGGLGSFAIIIQAKQPVVSDGLISAVQQAVNTVTASGNRANIKRPVYNGLEVKIKLTYRPQANRALIRQLARRAVVDYIVNIPLGESFVLNELIQRVLEVDEKIFDMDIERFIRFTYNASTRSSEGDDQAFDIPTNLDLDSSLHVWYTSDKFITLCD
jgi:uncharacterized phage protein gp47/JayE